MKLLSRQEFKEQVFERDNHKCIICKKEAVDAHHILDRKLFKDGGYYLDNGVSLCSKCHRKAEDSILSPQHLRDKVKITNIILPENFNKNLTYDKWGNVDIDELIDNFKTKYDKGFITDELNIILKHFPNIHMDKYNDALYGCTGIIIDNDFIVYKHDVKVALRCGIQNRQIRVWEWD